jgi:hypothetical protein
MRQGADVVTLPPPLHYDAASSSGSVNQKMEPLPGALWTPTRPHAPDDLRLIYSPRPSPTLVPTLARMPGA